MRGSKGSRRRVVSVEEGIQEMESRDREVGVVGR